MAKQAAPEGETKAQKFVRLAPGRVNKALAALAALEPLSTKANYEFTDEQVKKIFDAIEARTQQAYDTFKGKAQVKDGFSL